MTSTRAAVGAWALAAAVGASGCEGPAAEEVAALTLSCRPARINTAKYAIPGTDRSHEPERTTCSVQPINVEPKAQVVLEIDEAATAAERAKRGATDPTFAAGFYSSDGDGCIDPDANNPGDPGTRVARDEEVGPPDVPVNVPDDGGKVNTCFQCGQGSKGVVALTAHLASSPGVRSTPVVVECFYRNPELFGLTLRAEQPQVRLQENVNLVLEATDQASGEHVANQTVRLKVERGGGRIEGMDEETGETTVVLITGNKPGVAEPLSPVRYTCPDAKGLYRVTAAFDDPVLNGDARASTFVNCTDEEQASQVQFEDSTERLVADGESKVKVAGCVIGPEGPLKEDETAQVTLCANAGATWQIEGAEDNIRCWDCCDGDHCEEVFQDWDNDCSRVRLESVGGCAFEAELRAGRVAGTLSVVAESDLSELDYVRRNPDLFEGGKLFVSGDRTLTQVGIGDITFQGVSPRILGVLHSGFNESAQVCFQVRDTVGNTFPAGVIIRFDIPNNSGEATLAPPEVATDAGGLACTTLHAGQVATTVSVRATVRLGTGGEATVVRVVSPGVPIIGVTPSARGWALVCDFRNVGALIDTDGLSSRIAFEQPCFTQITDRFGNPVGLSTAVSFRAEAGAIGGSVSTVPLDVEGDPTAPQPEVGKASVIFSTFGALPKDVEPFNANQFGNWPPLEPRRGVAPLFRNPRDGLVAIIAYVSGEEEFDDQNSNGVYDQGEPFVDLAEPFVDYDDDNLRDPDEPFIDIALPDHVPLQHDGPNGEWDGHTVIWTETRVNWTGEPAYVEIGADTKCARNLDSTRCGWPGGANRFVVPQAEACNFWAWVADENLNLLNGSTTYSWAVDGLQLVESGEASVDSVEGVRWRLQEVPAGGAQPHVRRRRSLITSWGVHAAHNIGQPGSGGGDGQGSGRHFLGFMSSPSEEVELGGEQITDWFPATVEVSVQYSVGEGGSKSWFRKAAVVGCFQ